MKDSMFPIVIGRLLRIRSGTESDESPFPLDPDGFLEPTAPISGYSDRLAPGALVEPGTAVRSRALILLGEPGIGKSTVFTSLIPKGKAPDDSEVTWIDAANLTESTFEEELGYVLRELPKASSTTRTGNTNPRLPDAESNSQQTIVIDQVDESPIVRRLPKKLKEDFQDARRRFAVALVRHGLRYDNFDRGAAWKLVDSWRPPESWGATFEPPEGLRQRSRNRLLEANDFPWALGEAHKAQVDGDVDLGRALGNVTALLFDPTDSDAIHTLYHSQTNPAWEELSWWFEPVRLNSETANRMKRAFGFHRKHEREVWSDSEAFIARLNDLFEAVTHGDTDAFWQLAWNLQFDPLRGRGRHLFHDEILNFPGVSVLPDEANDTLVEAALRYVRNEKDHGANWLGTNRYDKRAWAGYLALALIDHSGRVDEIPDDVWSQWTGALIWFHAIPVDTGNRDRKIRLLASAAKHAKEGLARDVARYARGELARGGLVSELELISPAWSDEIADSWKKLLEELTRALQRHEVVEQSPDSPRTTPQDGEARDIPVPDEVTLPPTAEARSHALSLWGSMLSATADADRGAAFGLARSVLATFEQGSGYRILATHSARVMLGVAAQEFWPEVARCITRDASFGRDVALAVATKLDPLDIGQLEEEQLEEMYRWLAGTFPPEEDREYPGAHFVSLEEQARDLRDHVLRSLGERASEESIDVLLRLKNEFPERISIASNLMRARTNRFASAWMPPTPPELFELLGDSRRRFVRSSDEFAQLVVAILSETAERIPAHGELLWDRIPGRFLKERPEVSKEVWIPKPEAALSAYIARELALRLEGRGVAVNREVMVFPRNAYGAGDRTDILLEATIREHPLVGPIGDKLVVVVEVKCAWNQEVPTALRDQLAVRYLPEAQTSVGIYLVGWYPPDQWTDEGDYRRRRVKDLTAEILSETLNPQALDVAAELSVRITPLVIKISRPR
jgi:hypothetical protein